MPSQVRNPPAVPAPEEVEESTGADQIASLQRLENLKKHIDSLTQDWEHFEDNIRKQRLMRRCRVNTTAARADNKMQEGDIFIGVRTIDNNITQSLPTHVAYLKQSPRQAIFVPDDSSVPDHDIKALEKEFTRVMRYPKWEFDYIRLFDSSEFLGWGWVEVLYDRRKPGFCSINHVGTEDLIFDTSVGCIQESRVVLRRYRPTLVTLLELAKTNGFDKRAVKFLKEKLKNNVGKEQSGTDNASPEISAGCVTLFKVMFKEGGVVLSCWYSPEYPDKYLREPKMFWNGVKQKIVTQTQDPQTGMVVPEEQWERVAETDYPYKIMLKKVTEDDAITQTQGRGEMDQHIQQAQTTTFSSYVTQIYQSSLQLWAPKQPDTTRASGTAPKQSQIKISKNTLWDQPMENFTPSPPDAQVPLAIDKLATQNADNLNQPAFTVNARQNDSRKTAKEIEVATQQTSQITSTQVVISSVCLTDIQTYAWRIVQSQALQGNILFLSADGDPGNNRLDVIERRFTLRPAGDVDFIERQETEAKMQQDWPLVQATPFAGAFMMDYLRLRYPTRADGWMQQAQMQSPEKQVLAMVLPLLQELVTDDTGQLEAEFKPMEAQIQQVMQNIQSVLQAPSMPMGGQPQPTSPNANGSNSQTTPQPMAPDSGNSQPA
jgi:hypothetical protein